jgi:Na+-driven multidrug efflux pump
VFSHLAFGLSAVIRAEGGAVRSMNCMIIGFGLNLILDPLFIFTFKLGIAGAAWATNIAMAASCLWAFGYYWRGKTNVKLKFKRLWIYPRLLERTTSIGLAPFLQHFMSSLIAFSLQFAFVKWMPDESSRTAQLASLGVFQSALILVFMPMLGAQQGLQPIIGYNWGARNFARVLETLKTGLLVTAVLSVIAFIVQVFPPFNIWMASLFIDSDNPAVVAIAAKDLQISNMMIWCIFLNVVSTTYFQSIGRPKSAIVLSMLRQGVCLLPVIWFLPYIFENKPLAIWLSMPISDLVCNLLTLIPLLSHIKFLRSAAQRAKNFSH